MTRSFPCKILRVVDGDTIEVEADLGFAIKHKVRVRAIGIDCPQTHTRDVEEKDRGLQAKAFVENLLSIEKDQYTLESYESHDIRQYEHIIGDILIEYDEGRRGYLTKILLKADHAVRKE